MIVFTIVVLLVVRAVAVTLVISVASSVSATCSVLVEFVFFSALSILLGFLVWVFVAAIFFIIPYKNLWECTKFHKNIHK